MLAGVQSFENQKTALVRSPSNPEGLDMGARNLSLYAGDRVKLSASPCPKPGRFDGQVWLGMIGMQSITVWVKTRMRIAQLHDEHIAGAVALGGRRLKKSLSMAQLGLARQASRDLRKN